MTPEFGFGSTMLLETGQPGIDLVEENMPISKPKNENDFEY
jgi:hypothetical protein